MGKAGRKRNMVVNQGDIILLDFELQSGHEQMGRRPAVVVSNNNFNKYEFTVLVCPITNTDRDFPFRIKLDWRTKTTGFIAIDQTRAIDTKSRKVVFLEKLPKDILKQLIYTTIGVVE